MRTALVGACLLVSGVAHAQAVDRRYAEEPTSGIALPAAPLAGEFDARVVAMNPGGLPLVRGAEMALALGIEDPDVATSAGQGFGAFMAFAGGGGILPKFGLGLGFEWLRPSRSNLTPDPGEPFRFTLGLATAIGKNSGFGVSWHHFLDDGALKGVDTFDLGLSTRMGNHVAFGVVLRDLATAPIKNTPIQRRYEAEIVVRPAGNDRLDVALGGRLGETRLDTDGWMRLSARVARGFFAHAMFETRELHALVDSPIGLSDIGGRDYRATLGLEVSFGGSGVAAYATGLRDDTRKNHPLGGTVILRTSALGPASVIGTPDHIEKVELEGAISLRETTNIVARLRAIARDPSAKAVVVSFDGVSGGWATLQEIRDELVAIKKAGKKVFAYMVSGTGRDYFVASVADKIYIDPAGGMRLVGMAGTTIYFRGLFDQLGVIPQFEKIAEFKSAPEQFTEVGPSASATKMMTELFDSIWDQWLTQVAASRKLGKDELKALIDTGPFHAGDLAISKKLVDGVAPPDKISALVTAETGVLPVTRPAPARPDRWRRPGIAIIYVDGTISEGKSRTVPVLGQKLSGGETLVQAIAAARANPAIGAIILRIDSPGGSALASELISREVFATRGVKPILCSLGDIAASGGYFIAAGCDQIYAQPMTITGSIGIYYGKFDVSGVLKKLGVTTDTQKRGKRSDAETNFRPWTDDERVSLQGQLRYMYGRFVSAVAEGRSMKKDEVDAIGRGHVWTGEQAKPIKLVGKFGGLGDAIDEAKRLMKLDVGTRVTLIELPRPPTSLLGRLTGLASRMAGEPVKTTSKHPIDSLADLPVFRDLFRGIPATVLVNDAGPQMHLPFEIHWK